MAVPDLSGSIFAGGGATVEEFQAEQWLPLPPEQVFPFFADPRNLERITPPWLGFKLVASSPRGVGEGALLHYRLRLHGIPVRWVSRIETWRENECFVDVQVKGPYALWHHAHVFTPSEGGTLLEDHIRYRLPGGFVGRVIAGSWVRRDVQSIFTHRQAVIAGIFPHQGTAAKSEEDPASRVV